MTKLTPLQLAILQALQAKRPPPQNALAGLFDPPSKTNTLSGLLGPLPEPKKNYLSGLLGLPPPPKANALGIFGNSYRGGLLGAVEQALKSRNVFHSFHYADVKRVNQIRMCDQFRPTDRTTPRARDRSLWEPAKKTNPRELMRLIDQGLEGTSVTCVLAGTDTWSREWVHYEVARSLACGNGLLTVYIHNCRCPTNGIAPPGPNPLDQIALSSDMRIYEWVPHVGWKAYGRIPKKLTSWPKWLPRAAADQLVQLSVGANAYDWVTDDGAHNLIRWTDAAAAAAGK